MMKTINYVVVAAGAVMLAGTFLPYDFSGGIWRDGTLASYRESAMYVGCALAVIALGVIALRTKARWAAIAIVVAAATACVFVMAHFVPLFDDNPGPIDSLFHEGRIGAQLIWCASLVAALGGVALALGPQRIAARPVGPL